MGDPAGIGAEIIVKALAQADIFTHCIPIVIGNRQSLEAACTYCGISLELKPLSHVAEGKGTPGVIEYIHVGDEAQHFPLGAVSAACGSAAFQYIEKAIALAQEKAIAAVVTGPINKEALNLAGHPFAGHTEIFAHYTNTLPEDFAMLLMSGALRVVHATTHVSIRDACDLITPERVLSTINLAHQAAQAIGIKNPKIAVAGLNPHASENGLFGHEEQTSIIPAIATAQAAGLDVTGPIPPDTVFVKAASGVYHMVVAMYHDQGHIPVKLHGFRVNPETGVLSHVSGVNTTIGLPIIRTSVDHGTAFDLAGKNLASHQSLREALDVAVQMAHSKGCVSCSS